MGITPEVLDKPVPLTCKTGGDREYMYMYATLRELLSAADKFGVHFWSFDWTKIKDMDVKFRQVAKGYHPDKGAVDCIACFPMHVCRPLSRFEHCVRLVVGCITLLSTQ